MAHREVIGGLRADVVGVADINDDLLALISTVQEMAIGAANISIALKGNTEDEGDLGAAMLASVGGTLFRLGVAVAMVDPVWAHRSLYVMDPSASTDEMLRAARAFIKSATPEAGDK